MIERVKVTSLRGARVAVKRVGGFPVMLVHEGSNLAVVARDDRALNVLVTSELQREGSVLVTPGERSE